MPRARPGARKTSARRRIFRYRTKWTHLIIPVRIKELLPHMVDEWEDEDKSNSPGYVECEEPTMAELKTKGVPEAEWPYYLGYMKRMLALYRAYTSETLLLEKTNLIEEYVLRDKDRTVLEQVQEVAAECAGFPPVPLFTCEDVYACLEGDYSNWTIYDSFDDDTMDYTYAWSQYGVFNKDETVILLLQELKGKKYVIPTKTLGSLMTIYRFPATFDGTGTRQGTLPTSKSVLGTYLCALIATKNGIGIFKNGDVIQTLTYADLGFLTGYVYSVSISPSGKYLVVSGYRTATSKNGWVVLVGS